MCDSLYKSETSAMSAVKVMLGVLLKYFFVYLDLCSFLFFRWKKLCFAISSGIIKLKVESSEVP